MEDAELDELLQEDGETLVLRGAIRSNVIASCLVLGILLMMILIYYICKVSYKDSSLNKWRRRIKKNEQ